VYSIGFSPDSTRVTTVSRDVTARVWNLESGAEIARIDLDNPGVAATTFLPDGKRVATCSWHMTGEGESREVRGVVWIWDAETGEITSKTEVGVKPLDSIACAPDGTIVAGSWDGLVHVLDPSGKLVRTLEVPDEGVYTAVVSVAVSPDGTLVAAGSKDRTVRIWDLSSGEPIATLDGHAGYVNEVRFSGDGSSLVSASEDGTIRQWQVVRGPGGHRSRELCMLPGHTGPVTAIATGMEDQVFSASSDGTIRQWTLADGGMSQTAWRVDTDGTYSSVYSRDGRQIFVACYDGKVRVIDVASGQVASEWDAHPGSTCNTLDVSADGRRLVTCSWDQTARVWDTSDFSLLQTLEAGEGVLDCAISDDGTRIALAAGNSIGIWNGDTGERLGVCSGDGAVADVAISPDGRLVAAAGADGLAVYDTETRERVQKPGDTPSSAVAFSPDGKLLAAASKGNLSVWKVEGWKQLSTTTIGIDSASGLAFNADASRLAVGSAEITIVDPQREGALLRFTANNDVVYDLAFSPDGKHLVSCTTGGQIVISGGRTPLRNGDTPANPQNASQ
jgi:WD40 repeat protein